MDNKLSGLWNILTGKRTSNVAGVTDAPPAQEVEEIAATWRDPYGQSVLNGFLGKGPKAIYQQNPDPVLVRESNQAPVGYKYPLGIFRALMDKDAQVFASFQQLYSLILDSRMTVESDGEDQSGEDAADLLRTALCELKGSGVQGFMYGLLSAIPYGYHVPEALWGLDDLTVIGANGKRGKTRESVWVRRFMSRDPRRFTFDAQEQARLLTLTHPTYGEELPPDRFFTFRPFAEFENPFGSPLLSKIYWLCKLKHLVIKWWPDLCESYGFPIPIVKPQRPLSKEERAALKAQIDDIRRTLGLVLPFLTDLEFAESGKASSEMFHAFITLMDGYIARVILSQDFTVQQAEKGGTRSAGEIYAEAAARLARMHASALARFITIEYGRRLIDWNFGYNQVAYPIVKFDTSTVADKLQRMLVYTGAAGVGFHISHVEMEDTLGMQWATDDADWVQPALPPAPGTGMGADGKPIDTRPPYDQGQNPAGQSNTGGLKKSVAKAQNP